MSGGNNIWQKWMDEDFCKNSLVNKQIDQRLLIVTTNFDGFSLANCR